MCAWCGVLCVLCVVCCVLCELSMVLVDVCSLGGVWGCVCVRGTCVVRMYVCSVHVYGVWDA